MLKKISALISTNQKIILFFIFSGNFFVTGLEFLSLASVPIIISLLINPNITNSSIPFLQSLLEGVFINETSYKNIFIFIFFLFFFKNLFLGFVLFCEARFGFNLKTSLTNKLYKKYLEMNYLFHSNNNPGKLIRNIVLEVSYCCSTISQMLIVFREVLLIIIIIILFFLYSELVVFPVLFFFSFLLLIFFHLLKKTIKKKGQETQVRRAIINTQVNELINGIKEIKVFNIQEIVFKKFKKIFYITEFNSFFIKAINILPKLILEMTGVTLIVAVYFIYEFLNFDPVNFLPILSLIGVASIRAIPCISSLVVALNNIVFQSPSVHLVYRDLQIANTDENILEEKNSFLKFRDKIELKNIRFNYPGRKKNILNNISLTVKKGKKIGIIGSSGSGKSTIINLILGLIKPSSGEIFIDGKKIENLNLKNWRKQIGYVAQNAFLIDDNIKNNVAFGEKKFIDRKFKKALKKANLLKFVKSLKDKEYTSIGNNGIKVSGGQHQRIGIARALYNEPRILILDEATSSLDYKTEAEIVKDLNLEDTNLTAIIVSHRPKAVEICDIVYYLDKGKIKDSGKYKYLSNKYKTKLINEL